jgi:hypothetical protein
VFNLVIEWLIDLDENEQNKVIKQLQPKFGYPLGLYKLSEVELDEKDREDLVAGFIVEKEITEKLIQRIGNSDMAVTMGGPFPGENREVKDLIIFLFLFFCSLHCQLFSGLFSCPGI